MESIREIFRIGFGPSSSHTMGPRKAVEVFKNEQINAAKFTASLYGSLAATGKGHLTDVAILETFAPKPIQIEWFPKEFKKHHPNALTLKAFDETNKLIAEDTFYSIGGGAIIRESNLQKTENPQIYKLTSMEEVMEWCAAEGKNMWEYVEFVEGKQIMEYLVTVWEIMKAAVERGIQEEGALPGPLRLPRKAASYYSKAQGYRDSLRRRALVNAYALAVSEENASGGKIVTAPTCGSCGVLPAVLYFAHKQSDIGEKRIINALATAGLIGNLVKHNASISGAEVGCQGEIGTACAMAAGALTQIYGGTPPQIEYAAEIGLEHHLGLTCDPVGGLVQVPCIERNAFAATRALDANLFALLSDGKHFITFDKVVRTMKKTGHDLPSLYKETSLGGLAIDI